VELEVVPVGARTKGIVGNTISYVRHKLVVIITLISTNNFGSRLAESTLILIILPDVILII